MLQALLKYGPWPWEGTLFLSLQPYRPVTESFAMSSPKESKPRDTRLIHLLLSSLNVPAYEENVPLQLLTFAHHYVHSALTDAQLFQDHRNSKELEVSDVKLAIASKMNHSFKGAPPKEFLLELAGERNRRALPPVNAGYGLRLPPEKYCLTGVNWKLADIDGDERMVDQ